MDAAPRPAVPCQCLRCGAWMPPGPCPCGGTAARCDPLTAVQRANLARFRERRAAGPPPALTPGQSAEAEARIDAQLAAQRWLSLPCAPFARRCGA